MWGAGLQASAKRAGRADGARFVECLQVLACRATHGEAPRAAPVHPRRTVRAFHLRTRLALRGRVSARVSAASSVAAALSVRRAHSAKVNGHCRAAAASHAAHSSLDADNGRRGDVCLPRLPRRRPLTASPRCNRIRLRPQRTERTRVFRIGGMCQQPVVCIGSNALGGCVSCAPSRLPCAED